MARTRTRAALPAADGAGPGVIDVEVGVAGVGAGVTVLRTATGR
ncbi:MAG: hypothetical protein ACRDRO_05140 [Pseudonocardiaceae bacterium]